MLLCSPEPEVAGSSPALPANKIKELQQKAVAPFFCAVFLCQYSASFCHRQIMFWGGES